MPSSSVIRLLQHVWDHEGETMGGRSWDRLNGAMQSALTIAVAHGFRFAVGDFKIIDDKFNFSRWGGNDRHMLGERYYSLACAVDRSHGVNVSAAGSFEKWVGRQPFVFKWKDCLSGSRLAIGSEIYVLDEKTSLFLNARYKVTSFAKDGKSLGATHSNYDHKTGKTTVINRRKITHADLAKMNEVVVKALGPKFAKGDKVRRTDPRDWQVAEGMVVAVNARSVRIKFPPSRPGEQSMQGEPTLETLNPDEIKLVEKSKP